MGVGRLGELLDVQHGEGRVCDGLAEHDLGVGLEGSVQLLLAAQRVHKGGGNAHLLHGDGDEVEGAAVDGAGRHDVVARLAEVEQCEEVCSLTAGRQHGGGAALQLADLFRHQITGGVLQAGVEVAVGFEVEQLAHVLAGGILEGGGLDNGDLAGFAVAGGVAALHADGITVHCNILLYWVCLYSTIPRQRAGLRRGIGSLNFVPCRKPKPLSLQPTVRPSFHPTSQSRICSTAPLVGEPLAKRESFPLCQSLPSLGEVARRQP